MDQMTDQELHRWQGRIRIMVGGCHQWKGQLDRDGYGTFYLRRKNRRAHRVSYWLNVGPVPPGMVIDHTCRNRACVNPDHLDLVTPRVNALLNTRSVAALNAAKTHCPRGHAYDRRYGNQRYCSICEKAKRSRLRAKWRAEADPIAC